VISFDVLQGNLLQPIAGHPTSQNLRSKWKYNWKNFILRLLSHKSKVQHSLKTPHLPNQAVWKQSINFSPCSLNMALFSVSSASLQSSISDSSSSESPSPIPDISTEEGNTGGSAEGWRDCTGEASGDLSRPRRTTYSRATHF
jgi:hypothetical protein